MAGYVTRPRCLVFFPPLNRKIFSGYFPLMLTSFPCILITSSCRDGRTYGKIPAMYGRGGHSARHYLCGLKWRFGSLSGKDRRPVRRIRSGASDGWAAGRGFPAAGVISALRRPRYALSPVAMLFRRTPPSFFVPHLILKGRRGE